MNGFSYPVYALERSVFDPEMSYRFSKVVVDDTTLAARARFGLTWFITFFHGLPTRLYSGYDITDGGSFQFRLSK